MIELQQVWKSYGGRPALRGVSLTLGRGDALVLTGLSGAGKSTLLRLLYAAERPDRGELLVAGRNLSRLAASSIPYVRRNMGVVFQDFRLLPDWTVLDNVAVALEILGMAPSDVRRRSLAVLARIGIAHLCRQRAGSLSGGEQQRVALARAIVGEPAILVCDEPTGSLDPERAELLLQLVEEIHLRGTTILVATHDTNVTRFALEARWRRAHLVDGELSDVERPLGRPARLDDETQACIERQRRGGGPEPSQGSDGIERQRRGGGPEPSQGSDGIDKAREREATLLGNLTGAPTR